MMNRIKDYFHNKRRVVLYGGLLGVIGLALAFLLLTSETEPMDFAALPTEETVPPVEVTDSNTMAENPQNPGENLPPQEFLPSDTTGEGLADFSLEDGGELLLQEEDLEGEETVESGAVTSTQPVTDVTLFSNGLVLAKPVEHPELPHTKDWIVDALKIIEEWKTSKAPQKLLLSQYLLHEKLWVRLGALEVALETGAVEAEELERASMETRNNYPTPQIRRYMKRFRSKSPEFIAEARRLLAQ